jgi:hypothetical protein
MKLKFEYKYKCEHKRIAPLVEEPKNDAIPESHLVRRTQQYEV